MINRLFVAYLVWLVSGVLLLGATAPAFANESPVKQYGYNAGGSANLYVSSISASLSGSVAYQNGQSSPYTWSVGGTTATGGYILGYCKTTDSATNCVAGQQKGYVNYDPMVSRTWCQLANVAPSSGGLCPDPPPTTPTCKQGLLMVQKYVMTSGGGFPTHDAVCNLVVTQLLVCRLEVISGVSKPICMFETKYDGTQFTQNAPEPATSPGMPVPTPDVPSEPKTTLPPTSVANAQGSCPKGAVQGGSDSSGIPICIGTGTQATPTTAPTTTTPVSTTTNPDGSTSGVQSTTVTNSDGSKTTTTTTTLTAADGSKTVSQQSSTTANAAGGAGAADAPPDSLCAQNPDLTICKNSSVNGTCGSITCTGDAIQCATLRAAATMQCVQDQDTKDLKASAHGQLGSQLLAGSDPLASTLPSVKNASTVDVGSNLDASGWMGGGAFFADKTIPIPGVGSVVIPFSKASDVFLVFRAVAMVFGALVSAKILRQSVIGA